MKELLADAGINRDGTSAYSLRISSAMFALEGGASMADACRFACDRNLAYEPVAARGFPGEQAPPDNCGSAPTDELGMAGEGLSFLVSKRELMDMAACFRLDDWLAVSIDAQGGFSIELASSWL